jgi:leucyl aminopeptidase (aminopeptidase T)
MSESSDIEVGGAEEHTEAMLTAARSVIRTCMQIRSHEHVLIVTDPVTAGVGRALYEASAEVTDRTLMMMMPTTHKKGAEPPSPVTDLMRRQNVVLLATKNSLTHTRARLTASREGARIASMPGITEVTFANGGITADYNALQKEIAGLNPLLRRRREVHVTTPAGTDVHFVIGARWVLEDNGICNRPRQIMNLPSGRVFVLPKEETMTGKIVIDGSWDGKLLDEPLVLLVENGVIVNLSGGEMAEKINDIFEQATIPLRPSKAARVRTVAEFGFGMNSRSKLIGNMLEDQVVRGSAYFGFGDNSALGGKAMVGVHMRGVMMKPTVELQDVDLIIDGKVTARKK